MEYEYKAVSKDGQKVSDTRESVSQTTLARELRDEGLFLIGAKEISAVSKDGSAAKLKNIWRWDLNLLIKYVDLQDKMIFARHLGLMIRAGFSLNKALETLARQTSNKYFAKVIKELSDGVASGKDFHQVISEHSDVFTPVFSGMVKVGEASGKLEETLKLAALYLKREYSLKKKIKGAMVYPTVVLATLAGVAGVMVVFVLPQLTASFAELNVPLPLSTKIVFGFVNSAKQLWPLFLAVLAGFIWGSTFFIKKTESGKSFIGWALLHIPILADLTRKINSARFARTLSSLVSGGVSLTEALKITADSLSNIHYKKAVMATITEVEKGKTLSSLLANRPELFPPIVTEMAAVGEETGSLVAILKELARFFEAEVALSTKNLSSTIEPIIMVVMGVVVGIFALSIIQPIYSIMNSI